MNPGAFAVIFETAGLSWTMSSEIAGFDSINYGVWYDDAQFARVALKHAQAEFVSLKLFEEMGMVKLEIQDDGRGFDLDTARKSGGMGLSMLDERVEKMNRMPSSLKTAFTTAFIWLASAGKYRRVG